MKFFNYAEGAFSPMRQILFDFSALENSVLPMAWDTCDTKSDFRIKNFRSDVTNALPWKAQNDIYRRSLWDVKRQK